MFDIPELWYDVFSYLDSSCVTKIIVINKYFYNLVISAIKDNIDQMRLDYLNNNSNIPDRLIDLYQHPKIPAYIVQSKQEFIDNFSNFAVPKPSDIRHTIDTELRHDSDDENDFDEVGANERISIHQSYKLFMETIIDLAFDDDLCVLAGGSVLASLMGKNSANFFEASDLDFFLLNC